MRVRMTFTVDVDTLEWSNVYGTGRDALEVNKDVRAYFATHLLCAPAVEDGACDVEISPAPDRLYCARCGTGLGCREHDGLCCLCVKLCRSTADDGDTVCALPAGHDGSCR